MTDPRHADARTLPPPGSGPAGSGPRGVVAAPERGTRGLALGLGLALVAAVLVTFAPALDGAILGWDDEAVLAPTSDFRGLGPAQLRWMFTTTHLGHYQPLTWLSYGLDHLLAGRDDPGTYHRTNLLLHAAGTVLMMLLGARLVRLGLGERVSARGALLAGAAAAVLWGLHPLRAESVAWITERRDVLSGVLLLGAALSYVRSVRAGSAAVASAGWSAACAGLLGLSLLSKAWGMSFFVIALILDWYPLRRLPPGIAGLASRDALRLAVQKTPLIAMGVAAAVMAGAAQRSAVAAKPLSEWGVADRAVQSVYGLWFYVQKSLMPSGLSPMYELPTPLDPGSARFVAAYAAVAVGLAAALVAARRARGWAAAAGAYAVMLAPVLGVLQSGDQLVADRYSYLALVGPAIALAGTGAWLWARSAGLGAGRPTRLALGGGFGVAAAALAATAFAQASVWRTTEALWTHAVSVTPTPIPLTNLAIEKVRLGKADEAVPLLARAVELRPSDGRARYMLANQFRRLRRFADAEAAYLAAAANLPQAYIARVNLASMYINDLGRPADAVEQLRLAVADVERGGRRPLSGVPYLALGDALRRTGDAAGARASFERARAFADSREEAERALSRLPP